MNCPRCGKELTDGAQGRVCSPCGIVLPPASAVAADLLRLKTDSTEFVRRLDALVRDLADAGRCDELEALLLTPSFLEGKVRAGMTFELADDFTLALERLPAERPWRRVLDLLQEALLRDLHFISRHPETLFQCLWNSCWWYDCPEAAGRYDPPASGWPAEGAPWDRPGPKLAPLLESWRQAQETDLEFVWLRSLRPPGIPLGGPQRVVIPANIDGFRFLDLRFSPDGGRVFAWLNPVGTADVSNRQLRAWSASTGREAALDAREVPSHDPQVSPDGRWRVECGGEGGGWGRPVRLVDTATGREAASFETDPDVNIFRVHFSPGGERIIGGGWGDEGGGEVMVWNVAAGARLAWLRPFGSVFAVAVSFNREVAATGSGGAIQLWNLDTGEQSATLEGHEGSVEALAFSPDGGRLVSASDDGTVRVWDLSRSAPAPRLRTHGAGSIEFSEDGSRMLTSSGDETGWLWDARSGAPVACLNDRAMHYLEGGPPIPAYALRGDRVFSLLRGEVWEAATGTALRAPDDRLWTLGLGGRHTVWSPDGSKVAAYGHREYATISLTADLHAEPLRLPGHGESITDAAFSPDSRLLATASFDGTVRIWDTSTGAEGACLRGHDQAVSCVAFAPDGRFVASGAADRTVRVWDLTTGTESARIDIAEPGGWCSRWSRDSGREDLYAVRAVAFAPDGCRLVTDCGADFRLWNLTTRTLVRTFSGRGTLDALAAGLPLQPFVRGSELVIERGDSGTEVARVPVATRGDPAGHPDELIWAVGGRWLRHFVLSGPAARPTRERDG